MSDDIPVLPGHSKKVVIYFFACIVVLAVGVAFLILSQEGGPAWMASAGNWIAIAGTLGLVCIIPVVHRGKCPHCGFKMYQSMNSEGDSTGVFECRQCGSKWRTSEKWGGGTT